MQLITLTTDFGTRDWFVGTMKGVILSLNPRARIVDLTHEIAPGDVRAGAFALAAACRFFPKGTVHVAIVDPGVGSDRPAIAVQTDRYVFVGPDNGVLSWALAQERVRAIRQLTNARFFLEPVSHTFHGRDVFAPVAAWLSRGARLAQLGPARTDLQRLTRPEARRRGRLIRGEVLYVDRFGNAITNIPNTWLTPNTGEVRFRGRRLGPVVAFYQAVPTGRAAAVPGSSGWMEVAVNGGSAAARFGFKPGDALVVRCDPA